MKMGQWLSRRRPAYVAQRAANLARRYGVTANRAEARIEACMATLAHHGCMPTFPTPGRVVHRYPQFLRQVQEAGAEIAVHSYDHVDLAAYPLHLARDQLLRAAQAFQQHGIELAGFRAPYLSCSQDLLDVLPAGMFDYSSNQAIWWDLRPESEMAARGSTFQILQGFYEPLPASDVVSVPWLRGDLVEVPVCLPDDLQLLDGLQLSEEALARTWCELLRRIHRRGELFVLLFHPELAFRCLQGFQAVLEEAGRLQPAVWVARLREVSEWWREKARFGLTLSPHGGDLQLSFSCSDRATILVKGLDRAGRGDPWLDPYWRLDGTTIDLPADPLPFVGLAADVAPGVGLFLREQGYIVVDGKQADRCALRLDRETMTALTGQVELVQHIEAAPGPLVRYGRWPRGARSALCVTGDLDALTLLDYASRLWRS